MPSTQCLLVGLLTGLVAQSSFAAEREATLAGSSLSIDTPCATQVDVSPDPGLQGRVVVSAMADHHEELNRLALDTDQGVARIHVPPPGCWQPGPDLGFRRTLHITIRVPAGLPLDIDEGGAGRYMIGDVGGPMKIGISGAAELQSGPVTTLAADLSGAGTVRLASVNGSARVEISGHGSVTIGTAAIPELHVDMSGAGGLTVKSGHVGRARLDQSGVGSIDLDATVQDADIDVSGLGSVHLAGVTGVLHKTVSGLGSVAVGPR